MELMTLTNMKNNGFTELLTMFVAVIIFLALAAGSFYFLKSIGKDPTELLNLAKGTKQELAISDSDKVSDMQAELESTSDVDVTTDLDSLSKDASSL